MLPGRMLPQRAGARRERARSRAQSGVADQIGDHLVTGMRTHNVTPSPHFNDKQELLRYLLLGVERRCVETCLPKDWSGEARDYFLTAARNVLDFFQSRRSLYRACLRSGADIDAHVLEDQAAEDLVQLLSQPRFHTAFPDSDPRITARFYTGAMLSLLRWWLDSEDPVPVERLIAHLEHFIPAL